MLLIEHYACSNHKAALKIVLYCCHCSKITSINTILFLLPPLLPFFVIHANSIQLFLLIWVGSLKQQLSHIALFLIFLRDHEDSIFVALTSFFLKLIPFIFISWGQSVFKSILGFHKYCLSILMSLLLSLLHSHSSLVLFYYHKGPHLVCMTSMKFLYFTHCKLLNWFYSQSKS